MNSNSLTLSIADDNSHYFNIELNHGLYVEMGRFGDYDRRYRMNIKNKEYLKNIIRICKWQLKEIEKEEEEQNFKKSQKLSKI